MTTRPAASTPGTWKTDFAMSRPIVVIVCMDAPPNRGSLNSAHIFGTHVPVEEPSTASQPDSCAAAKHRRHSIKWSTPDGHQPFAERDVMKCTIVGAGHSGLMPADL